MLTHWLGRMRLLMLVVSSMVATATAESTVINDDAWRQLQKILKDPCAERNSSNSVQIFPLGFYKLLCDVHTVFTEEYLGGVLGLLVYVTFTVSYAVGFGTGYIGGYIEDYIEDAGWNAVEGCGKCIFLLLIILVQSVLGHRGTIIFGLLLKFLDVDYLLRKQIARQARRSLGALLAITVRVVEIFCALIYFGFLGDHLVLVAFFNPPAAVATFFDLVWIVVVNDVVLKFLTLLAKVAVAVLPAFILPYQKRGQLYHFLEVTSQLLRQLVPLQPWLMYLLTASDEQGPASIPNKVLRVFLTAVYVVVKVIIFMRSLKLWRAAFHTRYGKAPNPDQMEASGGICPICHDTCQGPIMLSCKHIYCEVCLANWLDIETTCPMCRARVSLSEGPSWRDGATSQFIQFF